MPYIMDYIPLHHLGHGDLLLLRLSADLHPERRRAQAGHVRRHRRRRDKHHPGHCLRLSPWTWAWQGAALATVTGSTLTVLILCTHFLTEQEPAPVHAEGLPAGVHVGRIFANGFTSFVIEAASGFTIFFFNLQLIRYLGNTGVTVYGIISNTALVVICLCARGSSRRPSPSCPSTTGRALRSGYRRYSPCPCAPPS